MSEIDQNNQNHPPSLIDEYLESIENAENELPKEAQAILEALESDTEFNKEMEELLSSLDSGTLDLTILQSKLLLLIKSAIGRLDKGKSKILETILKSKEKEILDQLTALSHHLMMQKSQLAKDASQDLENPKDKYSNLTTAAIKNTKEILKRFAIYQIYKVMNPRRIAGETRRENFVANFITGGIKKAMKYEGGSKDEIKTYSPAMLKNLNKAHTAFKKNGGRGL